MIPEVDTSKTLPLMQSALDRMAKAYKSGKGVRLSWEELNEMNCSIMGEWFASENPCKRKNQQEWTSEYQWSKK